ncbi:synaptosomal-associated protein 47-like [Lingula anatina]|uniref:Synaptosomal-associated protein 47 n=1 Tax=Lingula anatina TaxID=7574 RepID=A0A1S3HCU7_LINAN|nr:synaptosomal-associated protein 47-like [Lingula anatina]|eukprot:XP_013383810.1 synaptosomal-associated protein 47-like [Lingula anatina]
MAKVTTAEPLGPPPGEVPQSNPDVFSIVKWPAAYWYKKKRRWIYGNFYMFHDCIIFHHEKQNKRLIQVQIPFDSIFQICKGSSMFVYAALIIAVKNDQHWFSALPNRDGAYVMLEHFWKERLASKKHDRKKGSKGKTQKGQELLKITADSEKTLQKAATQLHHQGEQLDATMATTFDIHADLDVTENIISGLESWLGKWSASVNVPAEAHVVLSPGDIPKIQEYPVLFQKFSRKHENTWQQGVFEISPEGLIIKDQLNAIVQFYGVKDVSKVKVTTPWEIEISKFMTGQPDVKYRIMSTKMVQILKVLEAKYRSKMEYEGPPTLEKWQRKSCGEDQHIKLEDRIDEDVFTTPPSSPYPSISEKMQSQSQPQPQLTQSDLITDEELDELSSAVSTMKTMATDIGYEADRQNENIEEMSHMVEGATHRIKSSDKRVKKLT